jgi:hypothetical protein
MGACASLQSRFGAAESAAERAGPSGEKHDPMTYQGRQETSEAVADPRGPEADA